jgi:hypothetical protein
VSDFRVHKTTQQRYTRYFYKGLKSHDLSLMHLDTQTVPADLQ